MLNYYLLQRLLTIQASEWVTALTTPPQFGLVKSPAVCFLWCNVLSPWLGPHCDRYSIVGLEKWEAGLVFDFKFRSGQDRQTCRSLALLSETTGREMLVFIEICFIGWLGIWDLFGGFGTTISVISLIRLSMSHILGKTSSAGLVNVQMPVGCGLVSWMAVSWVFSNSMTGLTFSFFNFR